ncbi:MAG: IS4 family transposase [Burkholderiales bacterium]
MLRVEDRQGEAHRRWRSLLQREHYLGAPKLCGRQLRYLVMSARHGVVGALGFQSAAWRVSARDAFIGWSEPERRANLGSVVSNSRFLIAPQVRVNNLASHVLGLSAPVVARDWESTYGVRALLLESFVQRERFAGTSYKAATWVRAGATSGRGRQDREHAGQAPVKDVYVYPLRTDWRSQLCQVPAGSAPGRAVAPPALPAGDWAQEEFGQARLGDARLKARLEELARDFYARPCAQIPQACGTRARTKAAYRFFEHEQTSMQAILSSHYEASRARVKAHAVVLAVQDTTSLNYDAQPAMANLGPIGTRADSVYGLLVHDTMAFTPEGLALGLLDVQVWARDADTFGKRHERASLPIEAKESYKWLQSVQAAARVQARCPDTLVVSVGDREADVFELFDLARTLPHAPRLLIRAQQDRRVGQAHERLWAHMGAQPIAGYQHLWVPRTPKRAAREAKLAISFAPVRLHPPRDKTKLKPVDVWAVWARETEAPANTPALEWMLLTTIEVNTFEQALEKTAWYTKRWGIEVYHRTLKSGCKIETRQLGSADRIEACLAIDMVVAWRIMHLTQLGREHPDAPCTVYFADMEWKALVTFVNRDANLPKEPPSLREATRMVASLGGFLGRKSDGDPGTQTLWLGLQRLDDIATTYEIITHSLARAPPPAVSSG